MEKVTDPALIEQLNAGVASAAPEGAQEGDPSLGRDAYWLGLGRSLAWGLEDEIAGTIEGVVKGLGRKEGFWGAYDRMQKKVQAGQEEAKRQNPLAFAGGELTGALVPGAGVVKGAKTLYGASKAIPAVTKTDKMLRGAKRAATAAGTGGAAASTYAFNTASGGLENRAEAAKEAFLPGAATGMLAAPAARLIGSTANKTMNWAKSQFVKDNVPSLEKLVQNQRALYDESERLGAKFTKRSVESIYNKVLQKGKQHTIDPDVHPKSYNVLFRRFGKGADGPKTLKEMDQARQVLREIADEVDSRGRPTPDAVMAMRLRESFDKALDSKMNSPLSFGVGGQNVPASIAAGRREKAIKTIKAARQATRIRKKAELIDDIMVKAQNSSEWKNGNVDAALSNAFRSVANSKVMMRQFSKEEQEMILDVVRGTGSERLARRISNWSFNNPVSSGVAGASLISGNPIGVGIPIAGEIAKRYAGAATQKSADAVDRAVRSGKIPAPPPSGTRDAIGAIAAQPLAQQPKIPELLPDGTVVWVTDPRNN